MQLNRSLVTGNKARDNTKMDENSLISTEACETINIIKQISNSDAVTQTNTNAETNHGSNTNGNPLK